MGHKAHTDACKIQVIEFVRKLNNEGMSILAACAEVERESDGIPAETIRRWWQEIKKKTAAELVKDDQSPPTPLNPPENPDNQVPEVKHGGKREGAGAPLKYGQAPGPNSVEFTQAIHIAIFVISHLERITFDDPKRDEALQKVSERKCQNASRSFNLKRKITPQRGEKRAKFKRFALANRICLNR
jgi:hypothetical protein